MKGTITNLSSTVDVLKADNEQKAKDARVLELRNLLGAKLRGGFMTKVQHDTLLDQFKDVVDLVGDQGHCGDVHDAGPRAQQGARRRRRTTDEKTERASRRRRRFMALSNRRLPRSAGISLSDAVKLAGAQLADEAEAYREHFANTAS